jgi:hypothetical protein
MFIVWRQKPITSDRKTELFHTYSTWGGERYKLAPHVDGIAWAPLWCEHTGTGRVAWTPALVHVERVDGKPRQKLLRKFPVLRSCCMKDRDGLALAAWWYCIQHWQESILDRDGEEREYFQRDQKAILAKLREVAPRASKEGVAAFMAYRLRREAESRQEWEDLWDHADGTGQFRSFRFGGGGSNGSTSAGPAGASCWSVLGLLTTSTLEQVEAAYRDLARKHHPDRGGDHAEFVRV